MELLEKKDIVALEKKIDAILKQNELLRQIVEKSSGTFKNENRVMNSGEIQKFLGVKYTQFRNRIPILKEYGLFKDGTWKIRMSDLQRYIDDVSVIE